MSKGYHSRSPDEFKKYLQELSGGDKKKNWKQFILFLDVLLLLFVFYLASKALNPGSDIKFQPSERVMIEDVEYYFVRSESMLKDELTYFLFTTTKKEKKLPDRKASLSFVTESGLVCYGIEFTLAEKKIQPNLREYYPINFNRMKKDSLVEECSGIYKTPSFPRSFNTLFKPKSKRIDAVLKIFLEKETKKIILKDANWGYEL
ncbi:MAG: hypothetical protein SFU98_02670 [Leptospiraceae bacterium]|nr:hypothetical protein [Leptospiraceae bacterium]